MNGSAGLEMEQGNGLEGKDKRSFLEGRGRRGKNSFSFSPADHLTDRTDTETTICELLLTKSTTSAEAYYRPSIGFVPLCFDQIVEYDMV